MRSLPDSIKATKGRLGDSSLEDWPSFLENSRGEKTPLLSHVSRWEIIALCLHEAPGLAVLCICWIAFLAALGFGFIQLISWETPPKDSAHSSTAAYRLVSDLGIWTARRLWCFPHQPCDAWSPFSEDARSSLKYEQEVEVRLWNS
jgi:hypothetical protein